MPNPVVICFKFASLTYQTHSKVKVAFVTAGEIDETAYMLGKYVKYKRGTYRR